MEVIKRRCDTIGGSTLTPTGSHFSKDILSGPLPSNFKAITYAYDDTSDSHGHLLRFENRAMLHQYTDGLKCMVFLTTQTKSAQKWF
ncbi:hypothetical protein ACS0TY_002864 [Phlomoides rotata]